MRLFTIFSVVLLLALLASCGGGSSMPETHGARLAAPVLAPLGAKMVSGVPEGILVTWTRNTEPEAAGYYLYRDVNPIPTPPPDELMNPALRVNGGNPIAQPASGPNVSFTDLFAVTVGATYYYRVTVIDSEGTESYPSNEMSWTVLGQTVTGLNPTQAFWGDDVTLTGDTFGTYNPATDHVLFQTTGGNTIEGAVVSWDDTEIVATVPDDTITGPVYVVIDATIAATDDDLEILNPFIILINPEVGFVEQPLTINGANFGVLLGEVFIGATNVTSAVQTWSDTQIELLPPDGIVAGPVTVVAGGLTSNGITFMPRAEIRAIERLTLPVTGAAAGAVITLKGRYFGDTAGSVLLGGVAQPITDWQLREVSFTLSQSVGTHNLTVVTLGGVTSNLVTFTVLDDPTVTISGIDPLTVYEPGDDPVLHIEYPDDTEVVWVYVDGNLFYQTVNAPQPPMDFALDLNFVKNGDQDIQVRIDGRGATAWSNILTGRFYSLPGDINTDGIVNESDVLALIPLTGMTIADQAYRPWFDTDADGIVTEADASLVGYSFGNVTEIPGSPGF